MSAPFTDQGEAAVCARVALAWLRLQRKKRDMSDRSGLILIGIGVDQLRGLHFGTVRLALLSLAVWVGQHRQSQDWLKGVLMRDYYGFSIRRCYYADYKANRRG